MFFSAFLFSCDHPGCTVGHDKKISFCSIDTAREFGWAISRDRKYCYCPKCAPMHRNVGRYSAYAGRTLMANGVKYKEV